MKIEAASLVHKVLKPQTLGDRARRWTRHEEGAGTVSVLCSFRKTFIAVGASALSLALPLDDALLYHSAAAFLYFTLFWAIT